MDKPQGIYCGTRVVLVPMPRFEVERWTLNDWVNRGRLLCKFGVT
jgi:hypothetical protein